MTCCLPGGGRSQLALAAKPTLKPHAAWTGHVAVPAKDTSLDVTLLAPASVAVTVIDPHGKVAATQKAGSSAAAAPMRNVLIKRPAAGRWTVRVCGDANTEHLLVGASVAGPGVTVAHVAAARDMKGHVGIRAWLSSGTKKLRSVAMTAWVRETPKALKPLRLYDDGRHHDGKKDDGIYGALSPTVPAGRYLVVLKAVNSGDPRITSLLTR